MKYRNAIITFVSLALILLFFYTATDKLLKFNEFKMAMGAQRLPKFIVPAVIYLLPPVEILASILLIIPKTIKWGLYLSTILMAIFTFYVMYIIVGPDEKAPCTCGGIFKLMKWNEHLLINLAFLAGGILAIILERKNQQVKASLAM